MLYLISLFLHITGALLLAAATGIEWICITSLRRAETLESYRESISNYSKVAITGGISMFLILVPGIYMMAVQWQHYAGWIGISFIGLVLMGMIGGISTSRKMRRAEKALAAGENITPEMGKSLTGDSLLFSIRLRTFIFLGIVLVMVAKPVVVTSCIILAASIVIGSLPLMNRRSSAVAVQAETK